MFLRAEQPQGCSRQAETLRRGQEAEMKMLRFSLEKPRWRGPESTRGSAHVRCSEVKSERTD